jgi:hypothetical protein
VIVRWLNGFEKGSTIWEMTLHKLHQLLRNIDFYEVKAWHDWALILKYFLEYDADLRARCKICKTISIEGSSHTGTTHSLQPPTRPVSSIINIFFEYITAVEAAMLRKVIEPQQSA